MSWFTVHQKKTEISDFAKGFNQRLVESGEVKISGLIPALIKAKSEGQFEFVSYANFEKGYKTFPVSFSFPESFVWTEFPDRCLSHFECKISAEAYRPPYTISDYAHLYSKGVAARIRLADKQDISHKDCRCLKKEASQGSIVKKNLSSSLLLLNLQERVIDEHVKLGISFILGAVKGEGQHLPKWVINLFKEVGLYHLLVVSGYHLGVIILSARFFLQKVLRYSHAILNYYPKKYFELGLGLILVTIFICSASIQLPLLRALISLILFFLTTIFDRRISLLRLIIFSLIIMQVLWPLSILTPGVQMTFGALLGIQMGLFASAHVKSDFLKIIYVNLGVFIIILPIQYFWFGTVSWLSVPFNILFSYPFSFLVVGLGMISLLTFVYELPFGEFLLVLNAKLIGLLIELIDKSACTIIICQ